jgi:hypothetical protein
VILTGELPREVPAQIQPAEMRAARISLRIREPGTLVVLEKRIVLRINRQRHLP